MTSTGLRVVGICYIAAERFDWCTVGRGKLALGDKVPRHTRGKLVLGDKVSQLVKTANHDQSSVLHRQRLTLFSIGDLVILNTKIYYILCR